MPQAPVWELANKQRYDEEKNEDSGNDGSNSEFCQHDTNHRGSG